MPRETSFLSSPAREAALVDNPISREPFPGNAVIFLVFGDLNQGVRFITLLALLKYRAGREHLGAALRWLIPSKLTPGERIKHYRY